MKNYTKSEEGFIVGIRNTNSCPGTHFKNVKAWLESSKEYDQVSDIRSLYAIMCKDSYFEPRHFGKVMDLFHYYLDLQDNTE